MEKTFSVPKIRQAHRIGSGIDTAYWFEMDHAGESPRELLGIFDQYLNKYNWDKFITQDMTCIDIGGHSGDTAVPMAFLSRGTILSVEPNPLIKQYLDFCCDMNGHLAKFITAEEAVTTENRDSVTILDHNNAMCNGGMIDPSWTPELQQRMRNTHGQSITVPGLSLASLCDKYLDSTEIAHIGFIKTDTEGHDVSILSSSADFINTLPRRPVWFIEWFFAFGQSESEHMFAVIAELGYTALNPVTLAAASIDKRCDDLVLVPTERLKEFT
jgi:FkbM family methyltransferase